MASRTKSFRNFAFTVFDMSWAERLPLEAPLRYIVANREKCPNTKRLHFQCYAEVLDKMTEVKFMFIMKLPPGSCHVRPRFGSADACRHYCMKPIKGCPCEHCTKARSEGAVADFFEWGHWDRGGKGTRNDIGDLKIAISAGATKLDLMENFPIAWRLTRSIDEFMLLRQHRARQDGGTKVMNIECLVGDSGCGKSHTCRTMYPGAFWLANGPTGAWWDGYNGEDVVIVDEFYGWLPWDTLLRLTDVYPFDVHVKGGVRPFLATHIIFTSNRTIESWYGGMLSKLTPQERDKRLVPLLRRFTAYWIYDSLESKWVDHSASVGKALAVQQPVLAPLTYIPPRVSSYIRVPTVTPSPIGQIFSGGAITPGEVKTEVSGGGSSPPVPPAGAAPGNRIDWGGPTFFSKKDPEVPGVILAAPDSGRATPSELPDSKRDPLPVYSSDQIRTLINYSWANQSFQEIAPTYRTAPIELPDTKTTRPNVPMLNNRVVRGSPYWMAD